MASDYSFLTSEMVLGSNLVPAKYAGQDVRLHYSKTNAAWMGFWFATPSGHQQYGIGELKRMGFTGQDLKDLITAYMIEEKKADE